MTGKMESAIARLQAKLEQRGDCLVWTGRLEKKGYGRFRGPDGKKIYVHKFAYILAHGNFPEGLVTDHICRNPACCNPSHLEAVTNVENIKRGEVGRVNRNKKMCKNGHPFDEENTYFYNGKRGCKICRRINGRKADQKRGWKRGIEK